MAKVIPTIPTVENRSDYEVTVGLKKEESENGSR